MSVFLMGSDPYDVKQTVVDARDSSPKSSGSGKSSGSSQWTASDVMAYARQWGYPIDYQTATQLAAQGEGAVLQWVYRQVTGEAPAGGVPTHEEIERIVDIRAGRGGISGSGTIPMELLLIGGAFALFAFMQRR